MNWLKYKTFPQLSGDKTKDSMGIDTQKESLAGECAAQVSQTSISDLIEYKIKEHYASIDRLKIVRDMLPVKPTIEQYYAILAVLKIH